ncbi:MAG TPA: hypothetical protein VH208_01265 [Myxococcaceae bacterium]|nr:hypothetical protein [Myxococcaceae bacterium]
MKALLAVAVLAASLPAWAGDAINVHGALLPSEAQKVGENRYRVFNDWEGIKKFYKGVYPEAQYRRRQIINQPGIKAEHIAIPNNRTVEGLNLYTTGDENKEIRIYVVLTDAARVKKKDSKSGKLGSGEK